MVEEDPTARRDAGKYLGKHVLVVGSGDDLDHRNIREDVEGGRWDVVARVNKHYGAPALVGTRTDVVFTRWPSWLDRFDWFSKEEQEGAEVIILNIFHGYSRTEYKWLCRRVGHKNVSAGSQAIDYFLNRGASSVDVVGFGYLNGKRSEAKRYTAANPSHIPATKTEGVTDVNPNYDWEKENAWRQREKRVHMLP